MQSIKSGSVYLVGAIQFLCAGVMRIIDIPRYIHEDKLFVVFQFNKHSSMSSTKKKYYLRLVPSLTDTDQLKDDGSVSGSDADVLEPSKYRVAQSRMTHFRMHVCPTWRIGGTTRKPIRK